jgi:hypothetical protein
MTGEAPPAPEPVPPDPDSERHARRRARIIGFQVLLALGLLCGIVGAVLSVSVAYALRPVVRSLPPVLHLVAVLAISRLWAWALVPLAAWGAGRVLGFRPWATAFSIAAWGEALFVVLDVGTGGWTNVYRSPTFFGARVLTLGVGMALGWWLAKRGRAAAERMKARHEAEAEATRARYAKWLEEQTQRRS